MLNPPCRLDRCIQQTGSLAQRNAVPGLAWQ
jgi:hypothetical protein